ncbi:hypothetical protein [Gracilimonas mengyeensis]|uniref:Uncharacterized protein n=1 Tax=Gracilimonas mengyeensis TaxID=1302730 RepID=A0A521DFZ9_9BACT|nr:hypothetical protein [Gracilimonas mengyeensis]SMO70051.1 hypothetical protein SAMN06265219_10898 [Gracilimonas mengyeensis]
MSKNENSNNLSLKQFAVFIAGVSITYVTRVESVISFMQQMKNSDIGVTIMSVFEAITPIIIGIICWGIYWMYLKAKDWFQAQLDRIEDLENEAFMNKGESRMDRVENHLLMQKSVNRRVAEHISNITDVDLPIIFNKCDEKHKEFILEKGNNKLNNDQVNKIYREFLSSINTFHEPN